MVERQSPLVGLDMSPEVAKYVGILESKLAQYAIQDAKFRALLELLTGDSWEDASFDPHGRMIMKVAEDALIKTGMDKITAKTVVNKRWNAANVPVKPVPRTVSVDEMGNDLAQRIPPSQVTVTTKPMKERLQDWKARNKAQTEEIENASS